MKRSKLIKAMHYKNRWYKNCKNVRNRDGKICRECPFREIIEEIEEDRGERYIKVVNKNNNMNLENIIAEVV